MKDKLFQMNNISRGRFLLLLVLVTCIPVSASTQDGVTVIIATKLGKIEVAVERRNATIDHSDIRGPEPHASAGKTGTK